MAIKTTKSKFGLSKHDDEIISLDIGHSSVKFIQAKKENGDFAITKFGMARFMEEESFTSDSLISGVLKKLLQDNNIKKGSAVVSISGMDVCVRSIRLPIMTKEEIPEAVMWSAKKYVSFPLDTMVFSYSEPKEVDDLGTKKYEIVFLAAKKELVDKYLNITRSLGLKLISLTAECFSIWNVVKMALATEKGIAVAIVDIGSTGTDISIFKNDNFIFTRNVPLGSSGIDHAIVENLSLGENKIDLKAEEARSIKEECGLFGVGEELSIRDDIPVGELRTAMVSYLDKIIKELQLSFGHYRQISHGDDVGKIILLGGGSRLKNLGKYISGNLGMPVENLNPFEKIKISSTLHNDLLLKEGELFAVPVGALFSESESLNLVAFKKIRDVKATKQDKSFIRLIVTVVIFIVGIFVLLKFIGVYYSRQIDAVTKEFKLWEPKIKDSLSAKRSLFNLEMEKTIYGYIKENEPDWKELLSVLTEIFSAQDKIVLNNLKFSNEDNKLGLKIEVWASIINANYPESLLGEFMSTLEKKGKFKDISVSSSSRDYSGGGYLDFRLTCYYK